MSSAPSTAEQTVDPMRPAAPETATWITALGRDERGADRAQGVPEHVFVAADARGAKPFGRKHLRGKLGHVLELDVVDARERLVEAEERHAHQKRAAETVHPGKRRLHREDRA